MPFHLLVAISPHGFGHVAQTAPVVNAVRESIPDLRVTLRTTAPRALLGQRFVGPFDYLAEASDFGLVMNSAVDVERKASARAYAELHRDWGARVAAEAQRLTALAPDLILADVPYLTLAGAARAGIPAVALSSLNWADIYGHYCGTRPEAPAIHAQMLAAYNGAACFLQCAPAMPMPELTNRVPIGPVAARGVNRRAAIDRRLGLKDTERLVLVAPGGIALRLPMEDWPPIPGVRWLVEERARVDHPDVFMWEHLGLPFLDVFVSCDAVIGKPGYGTFAEAGCNGVPMLYLPRGDWPEEPYLVDWLQRNGRCLAVGRGALERGDLAGALHALWKQPAPPPAEPTGIADAARRLARRLTGTVNVGGRPG